MNHNNVISDKNQNYGNKQFKLFSSLKVNIAFENKTSIS